MCPVSDESLFSRTGFKFGPEDMKKHPVLTYHRMIEAFNFVAARETYLTDPAFDDKGDEVSNEHSLGMAQSGKFPCIVMSAQHEEIWV